MLGKNLSSVDKNDVCRVLDITTAKLPSATDCSSERLKLLAVKAVTHLELPLQLEVLNYFFRKHGVSSILQTKEFTKDCTEHFNKSVELCEAEKQGELMKQCVTLCLQSTQDFLMKAMSVALENKRQQNVVIISLKGLKDSLSLITIEGDNIILNSINKMVYNRILDDTAADNYISMVTTLINERLISGKLYVERFLLPWIHETASKREWSSLLIWLQTFLIFVNGHVKEGKTFNISAVLVLLAQLLEISKLNIFTYTSKAVRVREEVINITQILLNENADRADDDISANWLRLKLKSFLTPVNIPYFKTVWKEESLLANDKDITSSLIGAMHGIVDDNTVSELIRKSQEEDKNLLKVAVLKVLTPLTKGEWRLLSSCIERLIIILRPKSNVAVELLHIFADVILVFITITNEKKETENALNFLEFCIHNLGTLIMEKVCPALTSEDCNSGISVFQKVIYVFDSLPETIRISLCPVWINVCASVIERLINGKDIAGKETTVRCLAVSLTAISANNFKQPLAKKLLDVWKVSV